MKRIETELPGVFLIEPTVHGDARGFFLEFYRRDVLLGFGIKHEFVQDNHSRSRQGVLRGLHYQLGKPQAKLVRVIEGRVFDVAVDVRKGSPTFGRWTGHVLSAENKHTIYVPVGFAHGFYVMSETAQFTYKCSDYYAPAEERGIAWNDPKIGIQWPLENPDPILSAKDKAHPNLDQLKSEDLPAISA